MFGRFVADLDTLPTRETNVAAECKVKNHLTFLNAFTRGAKQIEALTPHHHISPRTLAFPPRLPLRPFLTT